MKTSPKKSPATLKKAIAVLMFFALFAQNVSSASAVVLFQDDTFNDIMSDKIRIGSNDAGAVNTAIQFGSDAVLGNNGNILWNVTTDVFTIDHTTAVTGGLSATNGLTISGGAVNESAASQQRIRESANPTTSAACASIGEVIMNTTLNRIEICTVTGAASLATWIVAPAGDASTLGGLTASQFLRSDNSDNFTSGTLTFDAGTTLQVDGTTTLNGTSNLNGITNIGDGGDAITVNSSTWDISSAGAASGFTTINASGIITGLNFQIGTTTLTETTSAIDSGAFLIGAFDEFDNTNSTNLQDILDDFDALVGSNALNNEQLVFHPEYPDAVIFSDGSSNLGTLVSDRDNTNNRNYYQWTSNDATTQDIDVRARIVLPTDFVTVGNFTFEYQTGTATTADNRIDVTLINVTDSNTTCGTSVNNASTTWATGTITAATITTGCTGVTALSAGDVLEVVVKLHDNSDAVDFSRAGFINFAYTN